MEMEEFAQMVRDVRDTTTILGKPTYELTQHEKDGLGGRRSLVAVKPIAKGEAFTKENVRSIRPAIGIKPKYYSELLGKHARREYAFGEPIQMDELQK
jgi:N-acetylneuraminate synthase/pseudaminic acid synthase